MIAIKDFKMPENCLKCPMQFGGWCYVSPSDVDERVATTVDEAWEQGKPDWCPLIDVPEMNVGNSSEIPNSSPDCISRQAAVDAALSFIVEYCGAAFDEDMQMKLKQRLEELPFVQPDRKKDDWTPCSKKLPTEDGDYLVTLEKGYAEDNDLELIIIMNFEVDCESFGYWYERFDQHTLGSLGADWMKVPVTAWMPLPEPWEGEQE